MSSYSYKPDVLPVSGAEKTPLQPHASNLPKLAVRLFSKKYLVRSIKIDDASDRWAEWLSDPEAMHMLNTPVRRWTKTDVINYIKGFDQRTHLLLGIFERQTWKHVGIETVQINYS